MKYIVLPRPSHPLYLILEPAILVSAILNQRNSLRSGAMFDKERIETSVSADRERSHQITWAIDSADIDGFINHIKN